MHLGFVISISLYCPESERIIFPAATEFRKNWKRGAFPQRKKFFEEDKPYIKEK
jgi:hypothetical protein